MNLLKYFTSRNEDLPASYVKSCEKFLKKIKKRISPQARKRVGPPIKNQASSVFPKGKINWFKKKMDRDQA